MNYLNGMTGGGLGKQPEIICGNSALIIYATNPYASTLVIVNLYPKIMARTKVIIKP
jgi:hypothetical protein